MKICELITLQTLYVSTCFDHLCDHLQGGAFTKSILQRTTLREECIVRASENRVLRRIFEPKRDEVTGECRKLHDEELNDLHCSPNIIRVIKSRIMRWTGHVACKGDMRGAYRFFVRRPEGKRPLGRPRRRWEDNIERDLQEVG
jgi:hypothetical protein